MEEKTLAMEMLHELKVSSKRWFIIAIVELVIIILTNLAWLGYESQYETETTDEQVIEDIEDSTNSNYTQTIN